MFPTSLSGAACRVRLQTLMAGTPIVMNTGSLRHLLPEPRFRIFCTSCLCSCPFLSKNVSQIEPQSFL